MERSEIRGIPLHRLLKPAIDMFGESFLLSGMYRRVISPRPAAKLGLLIISKCLLEFLVRVHNKRSVVRDRLSDRAAFEKEQLGRS